MPSRRATGQDVGTTHMERLEATAAIVHRGQGVSCHRAVVGRGEEVAE